MLFAIIHFDVFKRFAQGRDRRSAWLFAATLAVCCTLHLWFVILAGAEMLFLGLLKVADRLGWEAIRVRTPLRIETFLVFMTLGVAVAATVQAGIMPKFLFVLTQKHPRTIDAIHVLGVMGECVQGTSMGTETIPLDYRTSWGTFAIRSAVNFVAMVGLLGCVWSARKDANARFLLVFAGVVASTFFLVVDIQKPVYLYARFFLVLPLILAWAAAQGWSFLLDPTPSLEEASAIDRASTIPA
jgi:hypothetical protein